MKIIIVEWVAGGMSVATRLRRLMEDTIISLASPVNRQGRQVADIIAGMERKNKGSIGTAIVRAFGIPLLRLVSANVVLAWINFLTKPFMSVEKTTLVIIQMLLIWP